MRRLFRILLVGVLLTSILLPASAQRRVTVSGYMTDASSGEPLLSAAVLDLATRQGAVTNSFGYYTLTLPEGSHELEYSYMGYTSATLPLALARDTVIDIRLTPVPQELTGAVVTATHSEIGVRGTQMSAIEVPVAQIKTIPAIGGEVDILKALQLLPGVQSGTEGSAGMYIRGGGPDENLLLLDGVPLYNVNHMMGFFSVFDADAVKNVTLYKGSFPARFGSRLSGVVDVRLKDGNDQEFHWGISVGLLAAKINAEGPIVKGKTTFNLSLRRTYYDIFTAPILALVSKSQTGVGTTAGYYFYDLSGKLTHKFSNHDKLYVSLYAGDDDVYARIRENYEDNYMRTEDDGSATHVHEKEFSKMNLGWKWGNVVTAARWNHLFSPKLFMNTTLNYTRYRHRLSIGMEESHEQQYGTKPGAADISSSTDTLNATVGYNSLINDLSVGADFEYKPLPEHDIRFGADYIFHNFKPSVTTISMKTGYSDGMASFSQKQDTTFGDSRLLTREAALYAEDNWSVTDWLKFNVGLRWSYYHTASKNYHSLEPRLSLRFLLSNDLSFKASYSEMGQYLHLLSNSSLSMPTDLWVPVTDRIAPMRSHQGAAGVFYSRGLFDFSIEGYYKTMDNVVEYRDGASFLGSTAGWEDKVAMGYGWSYGVEFLVQKKTGNTTGWLGYTWARTMRRFDREGNIINFGEPFPAKYDRRHDLSLVVNHKFNKKIDLSGTFVFGSGVCGSLAMQKVLAPRYEDAEGLVSPTDTPYFDRRNNYRMPAYHRLDLGINFHRPLSKGGERIINLSLYNVYSHQNPFLVYDGSVTDYEARPDGTLVVTSRKVLKQLSIFPIMPSISWSFKF